VSLLNQHIASALDPVILAGRIGMGPDEWQCDVLRAPHQRELLVVHRQGGKSATAAVAAVHTALYDPGALILVVSPSQRQSQELFRTILTLYRSVGRPVPSESENALSVTLENGSRIIALPADATTIRGYSAVKLLIIDEAAFVPDDTMAAVRPMLAVSSGRMLAMSTPFGRRGWFYEASKSPEWRVTMVTADQCPRISAEFLASERRDLGEWRFKQEYECQFVDIAGLMFSSDDIDAIFTPAELGAIGVGTLFASARPISATSLLSRPRPVRTNRCRSLDGHFWKDASCIHCGTEQPSLEAVGVA
jgi:Helicase